MDSLRQIRTRKRVYVCLVEGKAQAQHHGPLSNQLGSPGEPEAKIILFYAEVGNTFVEV
jgi:hypothetical protein